jgi:glutamate synthase domain-containing protein 3
MANSTHEIVSLDATGLDFRKLNARLRDEVALGARHLELHNVYGQRYIGTDLDGDITLTIRGTPGTDLGAFLNGPRITVHGNAQDGVGNTMDDGEIIIHGHAGDVLAMSARGGKIFVRDDVGYRCAIHMKEYKEKNPLIVIGGTAQDFLAEYMAGGTLVLLGLTLKEGEAHEANFIGTGMHGGVVYIRGDVADYQLGKEVGKAELNEDDAKRLKAAVAEFSSHFGHDADVILGQSFIKLYPKWLRPYGRLYAY